MDSLGSYWEFEKFTVALWDLIGIFKDLLRILRDSLGFV